MICIRRGTFETNSSSTHCLSIHNSVELTKEQEHYLQEYTEVIEPLTSYCSGETSYVAEQSDLKEKLIYLWTLYLQAGGDGTDEAFHVLQSIVPKVVFRIIPRKGIYSIEDGDYLFDDYRCGGEILPWIKNKRLLAAFLLNGQVHVWNRDRAELTELNEYRTADALSTIQWSG